MVIGLVEALAPPDEFLFSAIGNKAKDPYANLMEWAKKWNPLNEEEIQSDLSRMSKLHTQFVIFENFKTGLEEADRAK